ncbi:MAG: hypothetical protein BHW55_00200 [Candidatus Melainabacteria bacterium 35_41]|nr:MAG: hypothetical protein BHW55_00200 [Candidatus Melainabacteria bacterium 35_41]
MTNNIHVTSLKNTMQVNVSSDMSNYYSKIAKDWAVSNDIVNNEDYSSKYYANKTKITADDALYSIEIEKENVINEFNNTKLEVITNIQEEGNKQISLAATQAQIATDKANEAVLTLENKANTDFSNVSIPYITSKYRNGNSWYRIWSDGWLEQGGTTSAGYNSPVTVSFIKQYDEVPLTVNMIASNASADGNPNQSRIATIVSRNSDKFIYTVSTPSAQSTVPIIWSASGYIIGGENEL